MKTPNTLYSRLALITSVTLITGYLIVSATWTSMNSVGPGNQLTADLWNTFVDNLNDLDTRLKSTASTWPTVTGGIAYTGGNVGIGTVDPVSFKLHIDDALGQVQLKSTTGTNRVNYRLKNTGGDVLFGIDSSIGGQISIGSSAYSAVISHAGNYPMQFGTNNTVRMTISNDGNVGIGTPNPGGYRTAIRGSDDTSGTGALWVSGLTAGTPGLMVRNDGNVGIGTATPGYKLEVNGSVYSSSYLAADAHRDSRLQWLIGYAGSNEQRVGSALGTDFTTLWSGGNERIGILSDGRVGIGTTNPYAKIHSMGQTFMMGSTTDLVWGSVGTVFQGEFGAASGNTYTKLESFIGGGSAYGNLAINPGGGNVGIGAIPTGTKLKITQATDNQWASLIENTGPTAGQNYGLTVRAGTNSSDISFNIMDKTSTNYYLHVRGDGNVGIGTNTPGTRLSVRQSSNTVTGGLGVENVGGVRGFYFWVDDLNRGRIDVASDGSNPLSINSGGGSVGINVLSPSYKLHVNGTAAGTSWTNLSDQRFKKNVTPINFALATIDKLRGVNFDWRVGEFKDRDFPTGKQVGFIAQEVEKVLPEVVTTDNDGYKGVEYSNITAVLVEAVKELKRENDELKKRIENLEKR